MREYTVGRGLLCVRLAARVSDRECPTWSTGGESTTVPPDMTTLSRIHTGVLPYTCTACGKRFRYKVTQRTHRCRGTLEGEQQEEGPSHRPLAEDTAFMPALAVEEATAHRPQLEDSLLRLGTVEDTAELGPDAKESLLQLESAASPRELRPEIKESLVQFRTAQGKRQLQGRLQGILARQVILQANWSPALHCLDCT